MAGASQDRGTFRGIARTLLALALLAERAAGRSFPVRFLVLVLLDRAEAIARVFIVREIEAEGWCLDLTVLDQPPTNHYGVAGAELLALRLRMLATVLGALADADAASAAISDDRSAGWSADCPAGWAPLPDGATLLVIFRLPARRQLRPPDTS